jgi:hypothetical protein
LGCDEETVGIVTHHQPGMALPFPPKQIKLVAVNDELEILLFDIETLYERVHKSAREVCSERGIRLREIDLSTNMDLAKHHGVRHFPQCLLFRGGKLIGETHYIIHTPQTLSDWLDKSLAADSNSGFTEPNAAI